jgi:hypothetical protein
LKFKNILTIIIATIFVSISCAAAEPEEQPSKPLHDRHMNFSQHTDPGEYEHLYDNLPQSITGLCNLIKKQLIHPFDIKKFGDKILESRAYQDRTLSSVEDMLEELLKRDKNGLTDTRKPRDRLIVACVHHSLLLASILRTQGIPVRIRFGYAKHIGDNKNIRVSHAICEVWDADRGSWILVDPDRNRVDFNRDDFEFASESWDKLRKNRLEKKFYISRYKTVEQATAHLLCHDLSYVIGKEEPYWIDPPIVKKIKKSLKDLSKTELEWLDHMADLLSQPDKHLEELVQIQSNSLSLK